MTNAQTIPLPKGWPKVVRSGVLHAELSTPTFRTLGDEFSSDARGECGRPTRVGGDRG